MEITRIDPPCWFVEMQEPTFQLLVYGKDLDGVRIETDIPHIGDIRIIEEVSKDYAIIYITLKKNVFPGLYNLIFYKGESKCTCGYILNKKRKWITPQSATITTEDVIYLIMTDRFAKGSNTNLEGLSCNPNDSNAWHGGNINGVRQHLSYLQDLGVTAIWLTPIFKNNDEIIKDGDNVYTSYHGYAITDFYDVDKHFGTIDDYCHLVEDAHQHNLKVVKDVVFNHCSDKHRWVSNPPMKNWFNETDVKKARRTNYKITTVFDPHASIVDKIDTVDGWFTDTMLDMNLCNKHMYEYLTQMTIWWIETTSIDAIRMDTYLYADLQSMIEWQKRIDKEYPGFSVIAETWVPEASYTAKIQNEVTREVQTKAPFIVMDFAFQKRIEACYNEKKLYDRESQVYYHFVNDFLYSSPENTLVFLDNHDLPRWLSVNASAEKLKQALGILFTVPRIPQLLYGTELFLSGDGKGRGDGNYRQDLFEKINPNSWSIKEKGIHSFIQKVLNWRKTSLAVSLGTMKHFVPQNGVYVICRQYGAEKVLVVVNNLNKKNSLSLSHYKEELTGYSRGIDIITGEIFELNDSLNIKDNGILILNLS